MCVQTPHRCTTLLPGCLATAGVLAVVRSLPYTNRGYETPYTGMVPIHSGGLDVRGDGVLWVGCGLLGAQVAANGRLGKCGLAGKWRSRMSGRDQEMRHSRACQTGG
jgi:hypothetical protein